jgi:hypothetical protein
VGDDLLAGDRVRQGTGGHDASARLAIRPQGDQDGQPPLGSAERATSSDPALVAIDIKSRFL